MSYDRATPVLKLRLGENCDSPTCSCPPCTASVRPGVWWGIPIQPLDQYKRLNAHVSRLPHIREELKELQARVKELEQELRKRNE